MAGETFYSALSMTALPRGHVARGGVGEALSRSHPTASGSSLYGHGTIREIGHVVSVLYEYSTPVFYKNTER